jgi:RNA polymerase sigma factor FliA
VVKARERMILDHMPQVRWIASSIYERLPAGHSFEDLVSVGVLGLIAAVDNYDPSSRASLRTYAEYRIRGAILDSLRGADGVAPHKRARAKQIQAAIGAAQQRLQRCATEDEIAGELGIGLKEYRTWLEETRGVSLSSLEDLTELSGREQLYESDNDLSPLGYLERKELKSVLALGVSRMPSIERTVIHLYFVEELTLAEIGRVIHLHASRVCQLKSQAILRLRAYLENRWPVYANRGSEQRSGISAQQPAISRQRD